MDDKPQLPERFGDAASNDPMGFVEHPLWKRVYAGQALLHTRTGWTYWGVQDDHEVWTFHGGLLTK